MDKGAHDGGQSPAGCRRLALWALLLAASLLLTACVSIQLQLPWWNGAAQTAPPPLRLLAWPLPAAEEAALVATVDRFVAANPGLSVTLVLTDAAAPVQETAADVLRLDLWRLPELAASGALAPLPADLAEDGDLYPALRSAATFDGQLFCAPDSASTLALIYLPHLFAAAGAESPSADWRWEELAGAAAAIGSLPAVHFTAFGLVLTPDLARWLPLFYQAGGRLVDEEGGPAFVSPPALDALTFYSRLFSETLAVPPSDFASPWAGEPFGNGRAGMTIEGNWIVPYLNENFPRLRYAVAELPSGPAGRGTVAFATCYAVAAESEQPAAAAALVSALTSAETLAASAAVQAAMPARRSAAPAWAAAHPGLEAFQRGLDYARVWQPPSGWDAGDLSAANSVLAAAASGDLTPPDAVEALER